MSPNAARIFRRSDSGDDLQFVSVCEETGWILSDSLGKAEGSIRICRVVLLGGFVPVHDGSKTLQQLLTKKPCFVVFDFVSLLFRIFLKELHSPHEGGGEEVFFYVKTIENQFFVIILAGTAGKRRWSLGMAD